MNLLLWIAALFALLGLGYCATPIWIWTATSAAVLFILTTEHALPWVLLLFLWVMWGIISAFLHIGALRAPLFSKRIAAFIKKQMPPISETEQAAIDAGDVWWDAALMRGEQRWEEIHSFHLATLTDEESAFLNNQVNTLCSLIDTWTQEKARVHSDAVWDYIKKERFFSMLIPKSDEGLGFSAYAQSCVVSKIATKDISTAVTVMVPNSLGPAELLLHYGTAEQKAYYLPRLANGTDIPCFGLTSPEAGSDAGGMVDYGIIKEGMFEGEKVLGIELHFEKRYITLAPVATVIGLAFKCFDPQHLLGKTVDCGITVCLLPADYPGIEIGNRHYPIGASFPNGTIKGKNIFVPLSWVIGGQPMVGQGWRMLMECLAAGRGISLPALASASSKLAYVSSACYGRVRKQFKVSIGEFEGVQAAMAEIGAVTYLLEAMRTVTSSAIVEGVKPAVISAIAKYHMTELGRKAMTHAMDIHGGKGIMTGPLNYLANVYMTMPVAITVEGANILTRNLIIFGQGAIRCHPFLLKEMKFALAPTLNLKEFDTLLCQHIKFSFDKFFKTIVLGLTRGLLTKTSSELGNVRAQRAVTRMSDALAFVSDITFLVLGGKLKRKEFLSARLGDVLSYLYMTTCMIKYAAATPNAPKETVAFAIQYCLHQIQIAFDGFFANFPSRWVGKMLRFCVFPFGVSYPYPSDDKTHAVAKEMMSFDPHESIWSTFYCGGEKDNLGLVMAAAQQEIKLQDALRTIRHFKVETSLPQTLRDKVIAARKAGIVNESDYSDLIQYCDLYEQSVRVDSFAP